MGIWPKNVPFAFCKNEQFLLLTVKRWQNNEENRNLLWKNRSRSKSDRIELRQIYRITRYNIAWNSTVQPSTTDKRFVFSLFSICVLRRMRMRIGNKKNLGCDLNYLDSNFFKYEEMWLNECHFYFYFIFFFRFCQKWNFTSYATTITIQEKSR